MKLTAFTDYCLRVLIYLASQPGRRSTIAEIAGDFAISENHLVKVVHFLSREGWLATVRGKGGGMQLAKAPGHITVGEVVRAAEGPTIVAECFDRNGARCSIAPICRLRDVLGEAVDAFHAVLDGVTVEDLVHNREALASVMFIARPPGRAPAQASSPSPARGRGPG